jgi:hypothetical protein
VEGIFFIDCSIPVDDNDSDIVYRNTEHKKSPFLIFIVYLGCENDRDLEEVMECVVDNLLCNITCWF